MLKAVIFDMDGLLIDSEEFWQEEERKIFTDLGVPITPELQKETYGLGTFEVIKHWYNLKPWGEKKFDEIKNEMYLRVLTRIKKDGKAMNGVEYIINFFKKKEIHMALATSSPLNMVDVVVDKLGIRNHLDFMHSCELEDYEKPHPAVYISTAKKLNVEPSQCLVFEDSIVGLIAAKAARMKTVSIPHHRFKNDLKYSISDLKINSLIEFTESHYEFINSLN